MGFGPTSLLRLVSNVAMMRGMQWQKWMTVSVILAATGLSCARKPEKSESAPVAPAASAPADKTEGSASEADQAPAAEPEGRQYAPAPAGGEAREDTLEGDEEQKDVLAPRPKAASPSKKKASRKPETPSAPQRSRGPVDSLSELSTLSIGQAERELEATFSRLGEELRLSSPDCPSAEQFVDRICELAEHICRLAEKEDEPEELALCVDGRNRCAESRRRYSEKCAQ